MSNLLDPLRDDYVVNIAISSQADLSAAIATINSNPAEPGNTRGAPVEFFLYFPYYPQTVTLTQNFPALAVPAGDTVVFFGAPYGSSNIYGNIFDGQGLYSGLMNVSGNVILDGVAFNNILPRSFSVSTEADLANAINAIKAVADPSVSGISSGTPANFAINFAAGATITLTANLPSLSLPAYMAVTINGNGAEINGQSRYTSFEPGFVSYGAVTVSGLKFENIGPPGNPALSPSAVHLVTYAVSTEADLRAAIAAINGGAASAGGVPIEYDIVFTPNTTIALSQSLPALAVPAGAYVSFDGNGSVIDGGGIYRGLVSLAGTAYADNLTFRNLASEVLTIASEADLRAAIAAINGAGAVTGPFSGTLVKFVLNFTPGLTLYLAATLPSLTVSPSTQVTVNGYNATIFGASSEYQGFQAPLGTNSGVIANQLNFVGLGDPAHPVSQMPLILLPVANEAQLRAAIATINAAAPSSGQYDIVLAQGATITLSQNLPTLVTPAGNAVTIDGRGGTIDGQGLYAILTGANGDVYAANVTFANSGPQVFAISSEADLRAAITAINAAGAVSGPYSGTASYYTLNFAANAAITLTADLPRLNPAASADVTINGSGATISGGGEYQSFATRAASFGSVTINNLAFASIGNPALDGHTRVAMNVTGAASLLAAFNTITAGGALVAGLPAEYDIEASVGQAITLAAGSYGKIAYAGKYLTIDNLASITFGVASDSDLRNAISDIDILSQAYSTGASGAAPTSYVISVAAGATINLSANLPQLVMPTGVITSILGNGATIDGGNQYQNFGTGLVAPAGVTVSGLSYTNMLNPSAAGHVRETLTVSDATSFASAITTISNSSGSIGVPTLIRGYPFFDYTTVQTSADYFITTAPASPALSITLASGDDPGLAIPSGAVVSVNNVGKVTFQVANQTDLQHAISVIDGLGSDVGANPNYEIDIASGTTIALTHDLAALNFQSASTLTINAAGATIDGGGIYRGLMVLGGNVVINGLTLADAVARGGNGGAGAGGGAGLGGGLFVGAAGTVTANNVTFRNDSAIGGNAGAKGFGGGGGGMGGNGGVGGNDGGGGGGGLGLGANGANSVYARDGAAGSALDQAGAGKGGTESHTTHYLVTSTTDYSYGGNGGAAGGGGGWGYNIGGGGGGISGVAAADYYTGANGFELSDNLLSLGLVAISLAGFPEVAEAVQLAIYAYDVAEQLGAPGYENYVSIGVNFDSAPTYNPTEPSPGYLTLLKNKDYASLGEKGGAKLGTFVVKQAVNKLVTKVTGSLTKFGTLGLGLSFFSTSGNGYYSPGGYGGFGGGGGGGGKNSTGGWGGFGGGGGAAGQYSQGLGGYGGWGGFGGGAGGGANGGYGGSNGQPGFGGGAGTYGGALGGGGLGAGGAIFVQAGGALTLGGSDTATGTVAGGTGANAGSAYGSGVFLQGDEVLHLAPLAGQSLTIGAIADQAGSNSLYLEVNPDGTLPYAGSVSIDGDGTVVMTGSNDYVGGTFINAGTLELAASSSMNPLGVIFLQGGTLKIDAGATLATAIDVSLATITPTIDLEGSFTGKIFGMIPGQVVTFIGAGTTGNPSFSATPDYLGEVWSSVAGGQTTRNAELLAAGATQFTIATGAQLQTVLDWIAAYGSASTLTYASGAYPNVSFDISLDGQTTGGVTLDAIRIPTLLAGISIVLDDPGTYADGVATAAPSVVAAGGTITLNAATPTLLRAVAGQTLAIGSMIAEAGGRAGLVAEGGGRILLAGTNSFSGGVTLAAGTTLELANKQAAGSGAIAFTGTGEVLRIGGTLTPTNRITGFATGDTIDLAGLAIAAPWLTDNAAGVLALGNGQSLQFGADLPADQRFSLTSDGSGGTKIVLNEFHQVVTNTAGLNLGLALPTPVGADIGLTLAAPGGTLALSGDMVAYAPTTDVRLTLQGNGQTIDGGGVYAGLVIHSASATLDALTLTRFDNNTALYVGVGASALLNGVAIQGRALISDNGTLTITAGSLGGAWADAGLGAGFSAGLLVAAPSAGATVALAGAIIGGLTIGQDTLLTGGLVLASAAVADSDNVTILNDTTLELQAGAAFSGTIDFAAPLGAALRIDGTALPAATIAFLDPIGEIDLSGIAVGASQVLTVGSNDALAIQGASGVLQFGAGVVAGDNFLLSSDGHGGARLQKTQQSASITNQAQYDAVLPALDALPAGVSFRLAVANGLTLQPGNLVLSGAALDITGAAAFTTAANSTATLDGANDFTGGVTLASGSTLRLNSAAAAGTGNIVLAGSDTTLVVTGPSLLATPIVGLIASDSIDYLGITPLATGTIYADQTGLLSIATASGSFTPTVADAIPFTPYVVANDGHGGMLLSNPHARQIITVATEAQLDAAILSANQTVADTEIVLAAGITLSLSGDLPKITPPSGTLVYILGNGATIDGGGRYGGLYAGAGIVAVNGLTLNNLSTRDQYYDIDGWSGQVYTHGTYAGDLPSGAPTGGAVFVGGTSQVFLRNVTFGGSGGIYVQQGGNLDLLGSDGESGGRNADTTIYDYKLAGAGIYAQGPGTIDFSPLAGQTQKIADYIADLTVEAKTYSWVAQNIAAGYEGVLSLTLNGAGTLELDGANAYSGATNIQAGTLILAGAMTALGGGITDNSALVLQQSADTRYAGLVQGTGNLIRSGAGTVTLAGGVALGGTISALAGVLVLSGGQLLAGAIVDNSEIDVTGSGALTYGNALTGTGSFVDNRNGTLTLAATGNFAGTLVVRQGVLAVTAADAAAGLLLAGGTLALGAAVGGPIRFATGAQAVLSVAAGVALSNVISGFTYGDVIDLGGVVGATAPTLLAGNILHVQTSTGTLDLRLDPTQDFSSTVFATTSDNQGGSDILAEATQYSVSDESALNAALANIAAVGSSNPAMRSYRIVYTPPTNGYGINATAPLQTVALGAGNSLDLVLPEFYTQGAAQGLHIASGNVTIDATPGFYLFGIGLAVDAGAHLLINQNIPTGYGGGRFTGAAPTIVNGTLEVDGPIAFDDGLQGNGTLILNQGATPYGYTFGQSSFTGTIVLNGGTVYGAPGGFSTIDLNGGLLDVQSVNNAAINFGPQANAVLRLESGPGLGAGTVIYGFAAGDAIENRSPHAYTSLSLGAGNRLSVNLDGGSTAYQFDPTQDFTDTVFGLDARGDIVNEPTRFTVATEAQLDAALGVISGPGFNINTNYFVTLTANISLTANLNGVVLGDGSTLAIVGQGHTIDGGNSHVVFSSQSKAGTLDLQNLTIANAGTEGSYWAGGGAVIGYGSVVLDNAAIQGGAGVDLGGRGTLTVSTAIGQVTTLAVPLADATLVVAGGGTALLTAPSDFDSPAVLSGITLNSGTLELGPNTGANLAQYFDQTPTWLNGSSVIKIDGAAPILIVQNALVPGGGTIDIANLAPGANGLWQPFSVNNYGNVIVHEPVVDGAVALFNTTAPLVNIADGHGGSLVYAAQTSFSALDETGLNTALGAIDVGGTMSAPFAAYTITLAPLAGTIAVTSRLASVNLAPDGPLSIGLPANQLGDVIVPPSTSLALVGGGATLDGGGVQGGLTIAAGRVAISNATFADFAAGAASVIVQSGASASLAGVTFANASGLAVANGGSAALSAVSFAAGSTLDLAAGATLAATGGGFASASTIALDAGALLSLVSNGATLGVAATIADAPGSGRLAVAGTVSLRAANSFSGGVAVNGLLDLAATGAAGTGTISLAAGSTLEVESGVSFANVVTGLATGGTILLAGLANATETYSNGQLTVSNGTAVATIALGDASLAAEGLVFASGSLGTTISYQPRVLAAVTTSGNVTLGARHPGMVNTTVTITDSAPVGGDAISGGFGSLTANTPDYLTGSGTLALAPGQSGTLTLAATLAPGAFLGSAGLSLASVNSARFPATLTPPPITISAQVYDYANPLIAGSVALGAGRVGGAALVGGALVQNGGSANAYQENLGYAVATPQDAALTASGAGTLVAGQSATIGFSLAPVVAGAVNDVVSVTLASVGTNTSGLANTDLGAAPIRVTGIFYNAATISTAASLDFGVVHVGDAAAQSLVVGNINNGGVYDDLLEVALAANAGAFSSSGTLAPITGGMSGALSLAMATTAAGRFSSAQTLNVLSQDAAQADLASTATVALSGTVDNYATASIALVDNVGTLSGGGTSYTLDFGTISAATTAGFTVQNSATGTADLLSGYFSASGSASYRNAGLAAFSALAAGSADSAPTITITPNNVGTLAETIVLHASGGNTSGYVGALPTVTINVTGFVSSTGFTVTDETSLNNYLAAISVGGSLAAAGANFSLRLDPASGTLSLAGALTTLNLAAGSSLTVLGAGSTIDGGGVIAGLIDQSGMLNLQDVALVNLTGALAVGNGASASLRNVNFTGDSASSGGDIRIDAGGGVTVLSGTVGSGGIARASGGTLTLAPLLGETLTIASAIALAGTAPLGVVGGGTLRLTGLSAFAGDVTVASTLDIGAAAAAGTGTITLAAGGVLRLEQTGTLANIVRGLVGGTIDAAAIAGGTATLAGNALTISNGTASLLIDLAEPGLSVYGLSVGADATGGTTVTEIAALAAERLVTPSLPGSVTFPNVHVGDSATTTVSLANPLLVGGDTLTGGFGALPAPLTASGSLNVGPGGTGTLTLSEDTSRAGSYLVTAPLALASESPLGQLRPIAGQSLAVGGTIFALAVPVLGTLDLGGTRVGGTLSGTVSLANSAAGVSQAAEESLVYALGTAPAGMTISGNATGTIAAGNSVRFGISLATGSAGVIADSTAVVLTSTGVGTSGLADTVLAGQTLAASGTVYAAATAIAGGTLDLGWTHVGVQVAGTIGVANSATGALSDVLAASFTSLGNGFFATGGISGLAAGATGGLGVVLAATASGTFSTTGTLALVSHDAALTDLQSTSGPIQLSGTVTNFATLSLIELSGGGTMSGGGSAYTLDLGTVSAPQTIHLGISNSATGFADVLSGSITATSPFDVTASGLGNFNALAAGQSDTAPTLVFAPSIAGTYSETLVIAATGSNAGGYSGALATTTLVVTGTVSHGNFTAPGPVSTLAALNADITAIDVGGAAAAVNTSYTIALDGSVGTLALTSALAAINLMSGSSLTLIGNGVTLDGGGVQRGLVVAAGTLDVSAVTLAHMVAKGGDGSLGAGGRGGGGGGAGLGGGLFVGATAAVVLNAVSFIGDAAIGGTGGNATDSSAVAGNGLGGTDGVPGSTIGTGGNGATFNYYGSTTTAGGNGAFGAGGGGGGAQNFGGASSLPSGGVGGFGAGSGANAVQAAALFYGAPGGGGGGLGAGADIFVQAGGQLAVKGGTLGQGSVAGGTGGGVLDYATAYYPNGVAFGQSGQGIGNTVFLQGGGSITLQPLAGQTIDLGNGIASDQPVTSLTLNGPGTLAFGNATGLANSVTITQGTLDLAFDTTGLTTAVQDGGTLLFQPGASLGVPTQTSTLVAQGLRPSDQLLVRTNGNAGVTVTVGGSGRVSDLAAAFNALTATTGLAATASGNTLDLTAVSADFYHFQFSDLVGHALQTLGWPSGLQVSTLPDTPFALVEQATAPFAPTDALRINGSVVAVGGLGQMGDLLAAINSAGIAGVSASLDAGGHVSIASSLAPLSLADASGMPLETLGMAAGTYLVPTGFAGTVIGNGDVVINQSSLDNMVLSGTAAWRGTTDLMAGVLTLTGDLSGLTGTIDNNGTLVFSQAAANSFKGTIAGPGKIEVAGGTLTLRSPNSASGAIALTAGALALATSGAGGSGIVQFGNATTLAVAAHVAVGNMLIGFGANDRIDLAGFDATTAKAQLLVGNRLRVSDAGGASAVLQLDTAANLIGTYFTTASDAAGGVTVSAANVAPSFGPRSLAWTGAVDGTLANAINWNDLTDNLAPATVAPGGNDTISLTTGGGTLNGTLGVAALTFGGGLAWTVGAGAVTVDAAAGVGFVHFGSGPFVAGTVGAGAGLLSIGNAATLNATTLAISTGTVTLTGGGSLLQTTNTTIGRAGLMTLASGTLTASGALSIDGALVAQGATASVVAGTLAGSGQISIAGGTDLILGAATTVAGASLPSVVFSDVAGTLTVGSVALETGLLLSGLGAGDAVDVSNLAFDRVHVVGGTTLDLLSGGALVGSLLTQVGLNDGNFAVASDGNGGTVINVVAGLAESTLGTLAPGFNMLQGAAGTITIGTAPVGANVALYDGTTLVGSGTANAGGNVGIDASALGTGVHVLTARIGGAVVSNAATLDILPTSQSQLVLDRAGANLVAADASDQVFVNTTGSISARLGNGRDAIFVGGAAAAIALGDGTDLVLGGGGDNRVTAGGGSDSIYLGGGANRITAGGGNDHIIVGDGANQINLGNGRDEIEAGNGANQITVGDGNDYVQAGDGNNNVVAGAGTSGIQLGNGNNTLSAGAGADTILLGNGINIVDLGTGMDFIRLGSGGDQITAQSGHKIIDLHGGGANTITLNDASALIYGGGNNTISFGNQSVVIALNDGANLISGGDGNDAVTLYSTVHASTITLGNGDNTVISVGGGMNVTLGDGNNYVEALGGDNSITVGGGNNVVKGDSGNDVFNVGKGYVHGNGPTDVFNLGAGGGAAYGGWGSNSININSGAWYVAAATGANRIELGSTSAFADIQSFNLTTDMLVLKGSAFGFLASGAPTPLGASLSAASDGSFSADYQLFAYNAANGVLSYRTYAAPTSTAIAVFESHPATIAANLFIGA